MFSCPEERLKALFTSMKACELHCGRKIRLDVVSFDFQLFKGKPQINSPENCSSDLVRLHNVLLIGPIYCITEKNNKR